MNVVHENILVEIPEETKKSSGGVLLPETEVNSEKMGIVVRFGEAVPEELARKLSTKPKIKFKEFFDGKEVTIEGKKYIVMNYKDILILF